MSARRSTRQRKRNATIYDDAKMEVRMVSPKPRRKEDDSSDSDSSSGSNSSSSSDDETSTTSPVVIQKEKEVAGTTSSDKAKGKPKDNKDVSDSNSVSSSSSSSSSSDEESEADPKQRPAAKKKAKSKAKKPKAIQVHVQYKHKKTKKTAANKKRGAKKGGKGGTAVAKSRLNTLFKKVLDPQEDPENSLLAAVLGALTATTNNKKKKDLLLDDDDDDSIQGEQAAIQYPDAFVPTDYTPILEPIVKKMLSQLQDDTNLAHVNFLNFIFRCVGGSNATTMDPETIDLEELDDDQWEQIVTAIVDDMRHTPFDAILVAACPQGAVFANDQSKHNPAQEEFRRIFDHFWYLVGTICLANSSSTTTGASFDIERLRDLANRMMELVTVGQPDLRSAATQGALMLALAACDGTLAFSSRLTTAQRQLNAAKAAKTATKEKALEQTVTALERSLADLEQVAMHTIIPGVFMRRYRDSDPYVRAFCLDTLSQMILRRPDLFLKDIYLKYYGWMMSDKDAVVRVAALRGLLLPFEAADEQNHEANTHPLQVINLTDLEKVIEKFLSRISDCVVDISVEVQQQAMKLLVALMRHGFMDNVEDENVWNQINLRALAPDATPTLRKDALYFIIEQLESFDVANKTSISEGQKVFQIDCLAVWVAHALSDGRVPMERLRVHYMDYIVESLRDMPEHSHLVTDWTAMIQAIQSDIEARINKSSQQRVTAAKQRVLLQMLATAAALEFGSSSSTHTNDDNNNKDGAYGLVDPELIRARNHFRPPIPAATLSTNKRKKQSTNISKERLTVALLKALPQLLEAFKGNINIMRSLTSLPHFFVTSVVTLPQRKQDVQSLIRLLGEVFLESTDATILQNTGLALGVLAIGNHARNQEALLELKKVALTVQDRLFQLYQQNVSFGGDAGSSRRLSLTPETRDTSMSPETRDTSMTPHTRGTQDTRGTTQDTTLDGNEDEYYDHQHSIRLCLLRLRVLSKKWYLGILLARDTVAQDESTTEEESESDPAIHLCATVAKKLALELKIREFKVPEEDDESINLDLPEIWTEPDPRVHKLVSDAVSEGMQLILSIAAWRLKRAMNKEKFEKEKKERGQDSDDEEEDDDAAMENATIGDLEVSAKQIIRCQQGLVKLLILCFDNHLDDFPAARRLSKEHHHFSYSVQMTACKLSCDLRTLFPIHWSNAESSTLRACAFEGEANIVGGFVRFMRDKTPLFADAERGRIFKEKMLLPLSRGLVANWEDDGNRREAAAGLEHIVHPSEEVSKGAASLNRTLKKLDARRTVESHMACLRTMYTDWVENEPGEPENDRPSEEEMLEFAEEERRHEEAFKVLEQKATKLAASLGVGKLKDQSLNSALSGFFKEGIRFAFSNDEDDDEFLMGSRLAYLRLIIKYLTFVKQKKLVMKDICKLFLEKEEEMKADPDFSEVREEDLEAVDAFAKGLGLTRKAPKKAKRSTPATIAPDDDEDEGSFVSPARSRSSNKRRLSTSASSVRSIRSNASNNLSPLYEEESEDDDVPIQALKKRKLTPQPKEQATIREGSDEDEGSVGSASAS